MESVIECIVCLECYNSFEKLPMILSCGHSLCKECAMKMSENSLHMKCPIDRKIEPKTPKQLAINYAILQMLNLQKTGVPAKEICLVHSYPITMICKTCSSSCCYKCIRSHSNHDIFDADHPIILNEIENSIKKLGVKVGDGLENSNRSCERIKKELRELAASRNKLQNEISSTYDFFIKQVESRKKESLEILEKRYREKEEFLNSCYAESELHVQQFESLNKDMELIRKKSKDKSSIDRAVTCTNMIKKLMLVQYPQMRDINSTKLRLGLDTSSISAFQIPTIKVAEFSPAEVLEKTYFLELEELQTNFAVYQKLNIEQKLSLEISCSSLFVLIQSNSINIAKLHLLNYCCWEILQQDYNNISESLRRGIFEKAELPKNSPKLTFSASADLLSKIKYVKGLMFALQKIHDLQWEDALRTLHCIIMKETYYSIAEEYLQVVLLRMCSYSFSNIKAYQVIDSLPIVQLITQYVKYHFLPSHVVYQQVVSSLKYAYDFVKNNLPDFFFPFFQQRYMNCLVDLELISSERLQIEYPHELQYIFTLLTEDSVRFWKDKDLTHTFVHKFQMFKEECSPWFQAITLIKERKGILLESELIVLERS